ERAARGVGDGPRCRTVVADADAAIVDLDSDRLTVRFPYADGDGGLDVDVIAPELLPGAVAVAVPADHEGVGRSVVIPLGRTVPVAPEPGLDSPTLVVAAHDAVGLERARRLGLTPVDVLDGDAVVRVPGPLD